MNTPTTTRTSSTSGNPTTPALEIYGDAPHHIPWRINGPKIHEEVVPRALPESTPMLTLPEFYGNPSTNFAYSYMERLADELEAILTDDYDDIQVSWQLQCPMKSSSRFEFMITHNAQLQARIPFELVIPPWLMPINPRALRF